MVRGPVGVRQGLLGSLWVFWGLLWSVGVSGGPSGSVGVHHGICLGYLWNLLGSNPIFSLKYVVGLNVRSL